MNDTKSASLVLIAGAGGLAWWWWHLTQGALSPAAAASPGPTDPTGGPALGHGPYQPLPNSLQGLEAFAHKWGLPIWQEEPEGQSGTAILVKTPALSQQQQSGIMQDAWRNGYEVLLNTTQGVTRGLIKLTEDWPPSGLAKVKPGTPIPKATPKQLQAEGGGPPF